MLNIERISSLTKLLSARYYLSEVPVEGRRTKKFYFNLLRVDLYSARIIRAGNCCVLLSSPMSMIGENFWKASHFDDFVRLSFGHSKKTFFC
jgi:hypothetical protein